MRQDLTGKIFGTIEVLSFVGGRVWTTSCVRCGHQAEKHASNLKKAKPNGCKNCSGLPRGQAGFDRLLKQYMHNATKNSRDFALTKDEFREITSMACHYCDTKPSQVMKSYNPGQQSVWNQYVYNGVDRKDNHVGYTYDNCLPCCGACNHMKGKKLYAEFTDWIGRVVAFKRHQNKVIVLVGMIASGKSTYCKNAARSGQLVVNDDSLVNMLHADDYTLYDKKLKTLYKSLENQAIGQILSMGRSVLVDRGLNCSAAGRQRWVALAKSFDVPCEAIVFSNDGPETHAHRRTASDARGHPLEYWLRVANLHHDEYQVPKFAEGFCKIHTISFAEIQEGRVIE